MTNRRRSQRNESWDFRGANTKELSHCFHVYPAMMIPQIARELIARYGTPGDWLFDPYCGTGTSLVEASLAGLHAVGCDINPLARLIAQAKTTTLDLSRLDAELKTLSDALLMAEFSSEWRETPAPEFPNRDFWFAPEVSRRLAFLRARILSVEDEAIRRFLWVAFSETARECSFTRNGEFKLYKMSPAQCASFRPDVFGNFQGKLGRNRRGIGDYLASRHPVEVRVCETNTAEGQCPHPAPEGGFHLVVTSPPYGDSSTTVAYGQFSRLAAEWIGLPHARTVDRQAMGGRLQEEPGDFGPVRVPLKQIRESDPRRARQVEAFYADLARSVDTVASLMARCATVCYVVGNRRVKGVTLPTDEFIADAFQRHGFWHVETIIRNIPNKRMPLENSPSNVPGRKDATMNEEHIVICRRGERV